MTIAGEIRLKDVPKKASKEIKRSLEIPNPSYQQAIRANPRAKYALSPFIKYYEEQERTLVVPRGLRKRIEAYCLSHNIKLETVDETVISPCSLRSSIELRAYQTGIPETIASHENGVVRLDTGYGKTIVALKVAELLQQKTLIVVPKLDILNQFYEEIQKHFGFDPGVIQGKNTEIKKITIATVQSLRRRVSTGLINPNEFGVLIVDEAHLFVPKLSRAVLEFFSARYRFGLTATARRTDGQGAAIGFLFGATVIDRKLKQRTPKVRVVTIRDHLQMGEYSQIIDAQVGCEKRNEKICEEAKKQVEKNKKILILTKRVTHYEEIRRRLEQMEISQGVYAISSKDSREKRSKILKPLRNGAQDFKIILGTFSLLSTGIDIPALDTLLITKDLKSDVLTQQSVGRLLRIFTGKPEPLIIDFWDVGNPILKNQGKIRQKFYKEMNWLPFPY